MRRRLVSWSTLAVFGVLVATLGLAVVGAADRHAEAAMRDHSAGLRHEANLRVAALNNYFERARAVNLVVAQNPSFREYYAATEVTGMPTVEEVEAATELHHHGGVAHEHVVAGASPDDAARSVVALAEINGALAQLQTVFPGAIGETCFIDLRGWENARVVRGEVAPADELSDDETGAPFFDPTVSAPIGAVHQARPYLSPDTDEWVISNSTLVDGPDGPLALVHFEVTLESFRRTASEATDYRTRVVDVETDEVIIDTDFVQEPGGPLGPGEEIVGLGALGTADAVDLDLDGDGVAAQRVVDASDVNANQWVVLVSGGAPAGFGLSFGLREGALAAVSLLALALLVAKARASRDRLRAAAETDPLTGLANRQRFSAELAAALESGDEVSVLSLDLNHFKEINDSMGHATGDAILHAVAERLRGLVRDTDLVSRFGGDEFAVLLRCGEVDAMDAAERIVEEIAEPVFVPGARLQVTASTGVAIAPGDGRDPVALLRAADMAMYHAKRHRLGVVRYEAEHDPDSEDRLELATRLRSAIDEQRLSVHFQPQVDTTTGQVTALEALARWHEDGTAPVPPDVFVPLAEDLGLIGELTRQVMRTSLVALRELEQVGLCVPVAINISARSLFDPTFVEDVQAALAEHRTPVHMLRVELTEGLLVGDSAQEMETLERLRRLGVSIALDDFGTGHSSLSYLARLPVDELKIDRSFVRDLLVNPSNGFILRSAVDLGHNLGLRTVAEGVESAEVLRLLGEFGCDRAQGYHIARPMPLAELVEWLAGHRVGMVEGAED